MTDPDASLWRATAPEPPAAQPLDGDTTADVAIVGAGYTGCAAALALAEAGADAVLLEARSIGHGGSGRNVGLVNAGLWTPPDDVEALLGPEAGGRLNAALAAAPETVYALIERLDIPCEAVRHGTLHLAHAPSGLKDLRRRLAQQQARQAPVSLLDAAETARRTGTDRFHGALLDLRAGTVQPLAYAIGLARAAAAAGARMHANTPVSARRHDGTAWYLDTPRGRVTARVLIDATNAYGAVDPRSPDHTPVHFFQAATDPLPADARARILPGGEGCWDTALVMSSLRVDAAGRLVVGAVGRLDGPGGPIHEGWARRFLRHLYPDLAALPFRHAWHGRIAMTGDHLPKVDVLGPMGIRIRGYSGRGIGPGTVFGLAAAQWALSGDAGAFPVAPSSPVAERLTRAKAAYYETGATLTHLVGAR